MTRAWNFSAGPATLPEDVLRQAQAEFLDWHGIGASIMEVSHRGKDFVGVIETAEADLRALLSIPDNYKVLFLQGGATLQFAQVPLNLAAGRSADYLVSGTWSKKALAEADKLGRARLLASSEANNTFLRLPDIETLKFDSDAAYVHLCTNETIHGVEVFPHYEAQLRAAIERNAPGVPLVADMSSHILSRPIDVSHFGLIYAGAQKNIGPAGLTLVIIREDLLGHAPSTIPTLLDYRNQAEIGSLLNTPPTLAIYLSGLVFKRLKALGGLKAVEEINLEKAKRLYTAIDTSGGFYQNSIAPEYRSLMNIPFRLPSLELETEFVEQSNASGFIGLKGHKSVGGIRASIYNAVSLEAVDALITFMDMFRTTRT